MPFHAPTALYVFYEGMLQLLNLNTHKQCWRKLLLKVMHFNIALFPKK